MENRKWKKLFSLLIIICGLYSLSKIIVLEQNNSSNSENTNEYTKKDTLATHVPMSPEIFNKQLPFHQVYESRLIGFPTDIKNIKLYSNKTKIILLWTPWNGIWETINYYSLKLGNRSFVDNNCPNQNCFTTRKRKYLYEADAVLFHLLDIKSNDMPTKRRKKQLWIMYNMEAPWLIKKYLSSELKHFKNIFNWTMTYRADSNINARYGYITKSETKESSMNFPNKTKNIVWFVSDCKTDSRREDYVNELKQFIDIDVYGTCGEYHCYPSQSSACYENILNKYKFYLSFENSICKDYITEKFFNIFNFDIVPIVFGGANYSSAAPKGTFIDATEYSNPRLLAESLLNISNNKNIYNKILQKKRLFRAYLDPWMCRLCNALHMDLESSILSDVEDWWLKKAKCKLWDKTKMEFVAVQ